MSSDQKTLHDLFGDLQVEFTPTVDLEKSNPYLDPKFWEFRNTPDIWWEKFGLGVHILIQFCLIGVSYILFQNTNVWTPILIWGYVCFSLEFRSSLKEAILLRKNRREEKFLNNDLKHWEVIHTPDRWWERYSKGVEWLFNLIWLIIAASLYDWVQSNPNDLVGCIYGMAMVSLISGWLLRWYKETVSNRKAERRIKIWYG
jgi:hypothetical protein